MKAKKPKDQNMEEAILAAAESLFLERGYARTSTVEIARQVGCNQALVHYYFRSKENLFQTVFLEKFATFLHGVITIDDRELPFEETVAHIVETHFDFLAANARLPYFILDELVRNPSRLESLKQQIFPRIPHHTLSRLQQRLEEAIAEGRVKQISLVDLAITMASLNVMLFVTRPIITEVLGLSGKEYTALLERRRQENIEIVLRSLKP